MIIHIDINAPNSSHCHLMGIIFPLNLVASTFDGTKLRFFMTRENVGKRHLVSYRGSLVPYSVRL